MSGDEAEDDEAERAGIYTIVEAEWQSDPLKTFLRALDTQYIKGWSTCVGDRGHGGKRPRRRIAKVSDAKVVDSVAPIGLWRNCYNAAWVERQDAWFIRDLCIVDRDYDFSLDFSKGPTSGEVAKEMQKTFMQVAGMAETDGENGESGVGRQDVQDGENGDVAMA